MSRLIATSAPYTATYEAAMKDFYDGQMQSLIPNLFPLVDWLKKEGSVRKVKPKGKQIIIATELRAGSGFGPRGENDYLPDADKVDTVQGTVPYQRGFKGRIEISAEAMKFGKEGSGSFSDLMKSEMNGATVSMRQHAGPAFWSMGDGVLAQIAEQSATTAGVPVVNEVYNRCYPGARWLADGMKVIGCQAPDTRDSETGSYTPDSDMTAAVEIASVNSDISLTWASAVTLGDADSASRYLVEHHTAASGTTPERGSVTLGTASSYRGPQGMLAMCDDGTFKSSYCGISESTYPQWKAVVSHNTGTARALTLDLFYQMFYKVSRKAGTFSPSLDAWMNTDVYREFTGTLQHYVEFKARSLKPGFKKYDMMVGGEAIPIHLDHLCPSYIFFLNSNEITFAEGCPPEIAKEHGSMFRFVTNYDKYETVWRWICQTYTRNRNRHGILKDIIVNITSI